MTQLKSGFFGITTFRAPDGALTASYEFYEIDMYLYRTQDRMMGHAALDFARVMKKTLRNRLQADGALGPFKLAFKRGDGRVTPHVMSMWEAY